MKRFVLHRINHTFLVIDITPIAIPATILPAEGDFKTLESLRFRSCETAQEFLRNNGANEEVLAKTYKSVRFQDCTVLSII